MMNGTNTKCSMKESRLSHKIGICDQIQQMSENECEQVLNLMQQELNCSSKREFIVKLLFSKKELFTNQSLNNLKGNICKIKVENNNKNDRNKPKNNNFCNNDDNCVCINSNNKNNYELNEIKNNECNELDSFPLLKLPSVIMQAIGMCFD